MFHWMMWWERNVQLYLNYVPRRFTREKNCLIEWDFFQLLSNQFKWNVISLIKTNGWTELGEHKSNILPQTIRCDVNELSSHWHPWSNTGASETAPRRRLASLEQLKKNQIETSKFADPSIKFCCDPAGICWRGGWVNEVMPWRDLASLYCSNNYKRLAYYF